MDLTNRQLNIVESHNKVSASQIRKLLPDPISIPVLNGVINKLVSYEVLLKIGRGRSKAYSISPDYN